MFERIHPEQGRLLSWKWGVLGFAAMPYASIAICDAVGSLIGVVASGFGYELPYSVVRTIRYLGLLPGLPLVDLTLRLYLLTDSWLFASLAYYALLFGGGSLATAIVRRAQVWLRPGTHG